MLRTAMREAERVLAELPAAVWPFEPRQPRGGLQDAGISLYLLVGLLALSPPHTATSTSMLYVHTDSYRTLESSSLLAMNTRLAR